jgi:hypothetical protein
MTTTTKTTNDYYHHQMRKFNVLVEMGSGKTHTVHATVAKLLDIFDVPQKSHLRRDGMRQVQPYVLPESHLACIVA